MDSASDFQDIFKSLGETFRRIVHKDSHLQVWPFQCLYLCSTPIPGRSEERAKHSVMQFCLAQSHPLGLCSYGHRRYHPYGCTCLLEAWWTIAQFTLHLSIFTDEILAWKPKTILPRYDSRHYSGTYSFTYTVIPHYTHRARHLWFSVWTSVPVNSSPDK